MWPIDLMPEEKLTEHYDIWTHSLPIQNAIHLVNQPTGPGLLNHWKKVAATCMQNVGGILLPAGCAELRRGMLVQERGGILQWYLSSSSSLLPRS